VPDADATAQQDGHAQPAAAHVLHLGDLVDDLAERVVEEVDEHEVDDRARARHRRTAAEPDESAFADWRVAEPLGSILLEQAGCCAEVSAAHPDAFAEHEDARIPRHLVIERLQRRRDEGNLSL
jgi:hypothetical protein